MSLFILILRFTEPGGVTVPGRADPDAVEERDRAHVLLDLGPDGRPQLPGTSLAGALREWIRAKRDDDVADDLFGRLLPPGDGEEVDARASRIWVLGSRLLDDAVPEYRASTKIDRFRGAAQAQTLRVEEVLPAGARFEVFLRWDDAAVGEIEDFAGLLAAWRPLIGRGVSRGRGRCVVEEVRHGTLCLDQPQDLLRWLTGSGPELVRSVAARSVPVVGSAGDYALITVPVSIAGPWRIGSGEKVPEGEPIPMLRVRGQFVVPGSGVKGVLRSRAEFILRSTEVTPAPCRTQQCGKCWTCDVFGHGGGDAVSSATVGARALVRVADAVVSGGVSIRRTHVAIDRFTGGALDGALYTMEALEAGEFVVRVEALGELPGGLVGEIRAVLRLVLEDLHDGIIGMGGGTARGYGSVAVDFSTAVGLPELADARRVLAGMVRGS
jgi:CRISPR/Cas system CSM-associated protein Csm3 (group 7 of RAMP superfamily)